jgi:hypothetical protein
MCQRKATTVGSLPRVSLASGLVQTIHSCVPGFTERWFPSDGSLFLKLFLLPPGAYSLWKSLRGRS